MWESCIRVYLLCLPAVVKGRLVFLLLWWMRFHLAVAAKSFDSLGFAHSSKVVLFLTDITLSTIAGHEFG